MQEKIIISEEEKRKINTAEKGHEIDGQHTSKKRQDDVSKDNKEVAEDDMLTVGYFKYRLSADICRISPSSDPSNRHPQQ